MILLQTSSGSGFGAVVFIAVSFFLYFLPSFIGRKKRAANAIFVLNLLLGWTGIGWLACLIWALIRDAAPVVINNYQQAAPPVAVFSAEQSSFCHACGQRNQAHFRFCSKCGAMLA